MKLNIWRWLGHTLRKGQDEITNQSLKWNPQSNRKVGRPKSTWKRDFQNELKKQINKTLSEASTVAAFKIKMERPCAWSTLYLEINDYDDISKSKYTYRTAAPKLSLLYLSIFGIFL